MKISLAFLLTLLMAAPADACGGAGRQRRHGLLYRLRHRHQAEETVTEYRETWYSSGGCAAPAVGYAAPEPERVEPIRKPPQSTLPAVK